MSTETLKTPEAPAWLSTLWNNPTLTTLSENVFAARLAEVKAMKGSVPDSTYVGMMKTFQEAFDVELKAGIAITSEADLTRIEKMSLAPDIDFTKLKETLATLKASGEGFGYFRIMLKRDPNGSISFKQDNSLIGNSGQARQFGIGNYGTTVHYEVNFSKFPTKSEFRESGRDQIIAKLQSNPRIQQVSTELTEKKADVKSSSREAQSGTILAVNKGQRMLLGPKDTAELKGLLEGCSLSNTCMNMGNLDVISLQKAVEKYNPNPKKYEGKQWSDGLCGKDTLAASRAYVSAI